jgi:hypothetical protein
MWSIIIPAAAVLLAQAQPDPTEKWCFERGQKGAQLCESTETACNDLLKVNPEIATGPCLQVEPRVQQSGSAEPPTSSEKQTPLNGKVRNR